MQAAPGNPSPGPGQSWLDAVRNSNGGQLTTTDEDLTRLLSMPLFDPTGLRCPDPEAFAARLYHHAKPSAFALRPHQVSAVYTFAKLGGSIIPLGVGGGKTYITLACAKVAQQWRGHFRTLLLVPTEVLSQLSLRDLPDARRLLALDGIPFYFVVGSPSERSRIASAPGPGVFVMTYHTLSTQTGFEELLTIAPTCFICDEAHNISRTTSARTKRWHSATSQIADMLRARQLGPDVKAEKLEVVALSGTLTKKKVEDYAHLCRRSLGEYSPAPVRDAAVKCLGGILDAESNFAALTDVDVSRMEVIIQWARQAGIDPYEKGARQNVYMTKQEACREAFQHRMRTAEGLVMSATSSADCSLVLSWREPKVPDTSEVQRMQDLMTTVVQKMITPDDDVIEYGMHTYKWLWELSAGFYNSLVWPEPEQLMRLWAGRGQPITANEADRLLNAALVHHQLQQVYHKYLRKFLDRRHIPGCDTPMLVAAELVRQKDNVGRRDIHFPPELVESYWQQKEAAYDDLPQRLKVPVRVCDYKVEAAVEWCRASAKEKWGGLVWFHHPEIGRWISERLKQEGIPHTCAFAGENEKAFAEGLVLASYAHSTGKNLQHQWRNLFVEIRREANVMEQTIGRTHRSGQKRDEVFGDLFISNGFDLALFNAVLRDADYAQSTLGTPQRLCYATYSPVVPPSNPRLAARLGIIRSDEMVQAPTVQTWQAIGHNEVTDWSDIFKPLSKSKHLT